MEVVALAGGLEAKGLQNGKEIGFLLHSPQMQTAKLVHPQHPQLELRIGPVPPVVKLHPFQGS